MQKNAKTELAASRSRLYWKIGLTLLAYFVLVVVALAVLSGCGGPVTPGIAGGNAVSVNAEGDITGPVNVIISDGGFAMPKTPIGEAGDVLEKVIKGGTRNGEPGTGQVEKSEIVNPKLEMGDDDGKAESDVGEGGKLGVFYNPRDYGNSEFRQIGTGSRNRRGLQKGIRADQGRNRPMAAQYAGRRANNDLAASGRSAGKEPRRRC